MFVFSDFVSDYDTKFQLGTSFLVILGLMIAVNAGLLMQSIFRTIIKKVRRKLTITKKLKDFEEIKHAKEMEFIQVKIKEMDKKTKVNDEHGVKGNLGKCQYKKVKKSVERVTLEQRLENKLKFEAIQRDIVNQRVSETFSKLNLKKSSKKKKNIAKIPSHLDTVIEDPLSE